MKVFLRWPFRDDISELKKAYHESWEPNFPFLHNFETLADSSFEKYLEILPLLSNRNNLPDGHVPCTFLIAFNQANEVVGRVSIRHELNEFLSNIGGHIGYGVTPSHRKKGYATKILFETLKYVRMNLPHLNEVLLTCDDDNVGSIKTIENNGGRFIDYYTSPELKVPKRRYTISFPVVRKAKPQDATGIHEAHMRSIQEVCSKDHSFEEISAWGNRPYNESMRLNAIKNDFVWVVEHKGEIEGFGHIRIFDKDGLLKAHIHGLYFTPEVLGFGLGYEIAKLMILEAQKASAQVMTLESTITAHAFYKSLGFEESGPMKTLEINGENVRCYPMVMRLNDQK
jgi:predicted acetyltransferase/N-acetylglutamate synthase-like GNAT family acetyltransferase